MSAGRPIEYTPEKIEEIIQKIIEYTDKEELPIVADFCYKNDIRKATLYERPELSYYIKRMMEKKEAVLEAGALTGSINVTMSIFSLKQLGWKDQTSIEHSGSIDSNVSFEIIGVDSENNNTAKDSTSV